MGLASREWPRHHAMFSKRRNIGTVRDASARTTNVVMRAEPSPRSWSTAKQPDVSNQVGHKSL